MCCGTGELIAPECNSRGNTWCLCATRRRGKRNLQSFALQLRALGKSVITLITFVVFVTPVALRCANDSNQTMCSRGSACQLWGARKNLHLCASFFFKLFYIFRPPRYVLGCAVLLWCSSPTDSHMWGWNWSWTGTLDDAHFPLQHGAGTVWRVWLLL